MIFGFNTDIKHAETVYHVQSEARKAEKLLQTQVFVRGRCIGKKATSYADMEAQPDFTEEHMHDLLKAQHRSMLDGIRAGKLNELLGLEPAAGAAPASQVAAPAAAAAAASGNGATGPAPHPPGLIIQWVNSGAVYNQSSVVMRFSVTENGAGVEGAQLTSRLNVGDQRPIYSQAVTDSGGNAEMKIFLDEKTVADAAVLVQAKAGGRIATRKFVLKRNA